MSIEEFVSTSQLSGFVSQSQEIVEQYPQMNEDNTKSKLLRDFLELLGWDIAFDAELEYKVPIGNSYNRVDYSLSLDGGSPVLFVEAKGYDTKLTEAHRDQLHSYLRQTDVNWGLLTNGEEYEVCRRENVADGVKIRTVANIALNELPDRAHYVGLVSKDALRSGDAEELAEQIFELRKAERTLRNEKEELADEIVNVLVESVGDAISQQATTEAKEMIDRLVNELEERTEETSADSFWSEVKQATGIKRTDDSVRLVDDNQAVTDYVNFVQFLFENDHISRSDLPIESGRIRYDLNTKPEHKDGSEMTNSKEVVEGAYLETHQNTADKKRKIVELGRQFGTD